MTTTNLAGHLERSLTLNVSGIDIPAMLTEPAAGAPASAVLLIPGSLFCDVNGDFPVWNSRPRVYAHLAEQLSALGHVVYRFAKLGPGTGSVTVDAEAAKAVQHWPGRMIIARAALAELRRTAPGLPLVLAGHSEGAVVASFMVHDEPDVSGVVLLSGPSVGLLGIMREQLVAMTPPPALDESLANFDAVCAHIHRGELIPDDLKARPGAGMLAQMDARGLEYMRAVDAADPALAISDVRQPVLIVQGGRDESVRPHHADRLRSARGDNPTSSLFFDELNHMYKDVPPDVVGPAAFGYPGPTDPRVTRGIDEWIRTSRTSSRP
jgi:alpha-beta hydrolase superfamily lysophospholipase